MLRFARRALPQVQALPQLFIPAKNRNFASTVLFNKSWEDQSVSDLRKEAKSRGLSTKGNKSTLITRIRQYEQHTTLQGTLRRDTALSAHARTASTASVRPGIPSTSQPVSNHPADFMHTVLPEISQSDPEPKVQVPYLPDFWDSKPVNVSKTVDPPLPKLVLVTGADTHHGGGPTHNLHDEHGRSAYLTDSHIVPSPTVATPTSDGLLHDVAQDLGIPPALNVKEVRRVLADLMPQTSTKADRHVGTSRKLDEDEARGVWVLFGLLVGSYVAAGIINGKPATSKEKAK